MKVHLGIDSTDSLTKGMCTTYVGATVVEKLREKATFMDYPNLVRLNPNIPYKTRGNGAVCLRMEVEESEIEDVFTTARKTVEELSVFSDPQTNPGIALYRGEVCQELFIFYERALHRLLTVDDAYEAAKRAGASVYGYKNRRGIIGALASIGETLQHDHTYELLAYRKRENWGKKKNIDEKTVISMDKNVEDVFFNYDYEEKTVCIAPHSVCPVLVGIRGETPNAVKKALSFVDVGEPVSKYVIFRTNQHTNFHFETVSSVSEVRDYSSVILEGEVVGEPMIIAGGHVFFEIENHGRITCAAFEPTKKFRDTVRTLVTGDHIRVYGGVKYGKKDVKMINLERLDILDLKTRVYSNPHCDICGKSMSSEGKGKGFQCKRCKTKKKEREAVLLNRHLRPGAYEPPPSAWRHLYKPIARKRVNSRKDVTLTDGWFVVQVKNEKYGSQG